MKTIRLFRASIKGIATQSISTTEVLKRSMDSRYIDVYSNRKVAIFRPCSNCSGRVCHVLSGEGLSDNSWLVSES